MLSSFYKNSVCEIHRILFFPLMRRVRKCKLLDVVNCVLSCVTFLWAVVYGRVKFTHYDEDFIYVWPELLVVQSSSTWTCISARTTTQDEFWLYHHSSYISFLHNILVFASGCLRWVLVNSCMVLWAGFQREGRHFCFQQHCQKCWLSLQKLVSMILY